MPARVIRGNGEVVEDERHPPDGPREKFIQRLIEAAITAAVVYFVTVAAGKPRETEASLVQLDKRTALLEQSMGTIKDDLKDIKRAVGARSR